LFFQFLIEISAPFATVRLWVNFVKLESTKEVWVIEEIDGSLTKILSH
jgi:hypothetical protein